MIESLSSVDGVALFWFVIAWAGYTYYADTYSRNRASLMTVMYQYRLEWMKQSLKREVRVGDASLLATLTRSISLFASTAIFILGGVVAIFGGLEQVQDLTKDLTYVAKTSKIMWGNKAADAGVCFYLCLLQVCLGLASVQLYDHCDGSLSPTCRSQNRSCAKYC